MQFNTQRLCLHPLTIPQLELWINNLPALEQELDLTYPADAEPMIGVFREIVRGQLENASQDAGNYIWHTFWLLIRRSDRLVVGSADFKAPPNEQGEVEIGYGLGKTYQHQGYMTEAVQAMCEWAWQQPAVRSILAETEPDNLASQRLLQRCNFHSFRQGKTLWWKSTKRQ